MIYLHSRFDKKCGASGIAANKKCSKPTSSAPTQASESSTGRNLAVGGAAALATAGAAVGGALAFKNRAGLRSAASSLGRTLRPSTGKFEGRAVRTKPQAASPKPKASPATDPWGPPTTPPRTGATMRTSKPAATPKSDPSAPTVAREVSPVTTRLNREGLAKASSWRKKQRSARTSKKVNLSAKGTLYQRPKMLGGPRGRQTGAERENAINPRYAAYKADPYTKTGRRPDITPTDLLWVKRERRKRKSPLEPPTRGIW